MKFIVLFTFLYTTLALNAQNLVPNPSFEIYTICPTNYTDESVHELIPGWQIPTRGSSDYFNSCALISVNVPENFMGNCFARDGQAYAGFILLEEPPIDSVFKKASYREYIQAELIQPLKHNNLYCVKFYYAIATNSTYAINRLGVYFSKKKIRDRFSAGVLNFKPQIQIDTLKINSDREYWFLEADTFRAQGGEKYITIGNFYDDNHTRYKTLDLTGYRLSLREKIESLKLAYYYIDMISVEKLDNSENCLEPVEK